MIGHVLESMNEVITNGYSENHQALDIVSGDHAGSDVIALESGTIEEVVKNIPSTDHSSRGLATYGNYVKIRQNNGKSALYAHMKYGSVDANVGDYVEKGSIIGTMGSTGNAYGDHLHLEIKNENNVRENPIISLNEVADESYDVEVTSEDVSDNVVTISNEVKNSEPEKVQEINEEKIVNNSYSGGSIVDGLKGIGVDSSYSYREKLAQKNGIAEYRGSFEQNVKLLKLLKEGKLIKA